MTDEGVVVLLGFAPEIWTLIHVGVGESLEGSLDEVTLGLGGSTGGGIDVLDTCELQDLLGGGGSDDAGTSGGGNKSDTNRS